MTDDIDSGISINLSGHNTGSFPRSHEKRPKLGGSRSKRIKARKDIKRQRESFHAHRDVDDEHASGQGPGISAEFGDSGQASPSGKGDYRKEPGMSGDMEIASSSGKGDRRKEPQKKTGVVISSLFRHNPDIPAVPSTTVTPVKESLFSSDSFQDVPLHPYMVSNLVKLGFTKMTAVQQESLPKLMDGHDLLVKSQTGSGKTMAYAIPIIEDLCRRSPKLQRGDGTMAVVIVPTRELVLQSYAVFLKLIQPYTWLVPGCIMGGEKKKAEKARLRKGITILIATPGRLIDHIENTQNLILNRVKWLVLDEADRLLDLGFEAAVSKIVSAVDNQSTQVDRQTVLLSATLTSGVERLAGISLKNPKRVSINKSNAVKMEDGLSRDVKMEDGLSRDALEEEESAGSFAVPENLQQHFVITPCKLRLVSLLTLILTKCKRTTSTKMIVFLTTQDSVEFHYRLVHYLVSDHQSSDVSDEEDQEPVYTSVEVFRLHGDMSQKDRTATFHNYCSAKSGVLLCTDVAARGLHLPSVQWVVQYSCPIGVTSYIHRVGRTARAGTSGMALMFVLPSEVSFIQTLQDKTISINEMKMGKILQDVMKLVPSLPGADDTQRQLPRTVEESAMYVQMCCENYISKNKEMMSLAKQAYQSYVRGYATYPTHLKMIFHVKHLHLGHVAKTFGLREAPSSISGVTGINKKTLIGKRKRKEEKDRPRRPHYPRVSPMSEFTGAPVFTTPVKPPYKPPHKKRRM